jgi:hypothetical protein
MELLTIWILLGILYLTKSVFAYLRELFTVIELLKYDGLIIYVQIIAVTTSYRSLPHVYEKEFTRKSKSRMQGLLLIMAGVYFWRYYQVFVMKH